MCLQLFSRAVVEANDVFVLLVSKLQDINFAILWEPLRYPSNVAPSNILGATVPHVHRILSHLESVVEQAKTELAGGFSLGRSCYRKIKSQ